MSMVFSEDPKKAGQRSYTGLAIVAGLHVALGYALLNGLGHAVVEVMKGPLETKLIDEIKLPPPPPPPPQLPQPKTLPPVQSYAPPPELPVPQQTNTPVITTVAVQPPPGPVTISPPTPPAPPAPPRVAARPAQIDVGSCAKPEYPAAAARSEATGITRIRFTVDGEGKVVKADLLAASGPTREHRLLDRIAVEALGACRFKPGIDESGAPVGGFANVDYAWKLE